MSFQKSKDSIGWIREGKLTPDAGGLGSLYVVSSSQVLLWKDILFASLEVFASKQPSVTDCYRPEIFNIDAP